MKSTFQLPDTSAAPIPITAMPAPMPNRTKIALRNCFNSLTPSVSSATLLLSFFLQYVIGSFLIRRIDQIQTPYRQESRDHYKKYPVPASVQGTPKTVIRITTRTTSTSRVNLLHPEVHSVGEVHRNSDGQIQQPDTCQQLKCANGLMK